MFLFVPPVAPVRHMWVTPAAARPSRKRARARARHPSVVCARQQDTEQDELFFDGLSYPVDSLDWCSTEDANGCSSETIDDMSLVSESEKTNAFRIRIKEASKKRIAVAEGEALALEDDDLGPCSAVTFSQRVDKTFVNTFRQSSPYINAHRGRVFVIHLPGSLIEEGLCGSVMEDIALMRIVGIKLVLVLGPRCQIERRLNAEGIKSRFIEGARVTDARTLEIVKEAAGSMMFEVESKLSRGVVNMPSTSQLSIITSNFYTAKPLGVIDGEDFGFTGCVRKFDAEGLNRRLDEGDIVVLRNVGSSPSGQLFNCQSEDVAGACAGALKAEKLIFMANGESIYDKRKGRTIPNLTLSSAQSFLDLRARELPVHFERALSTSVRALNKGVTRAHLLNRAIDGVLLMEIFHRDGVGLMISRDLYEGIRLARSDDVAGIDTIIKPLEDNGTLVKRDRATLEDGISDFIVVERDGMIIACLSLSSMSDDKAWAELGCLAVHPDYRRLGKGDAMLGFTERYAYSIGVRNLFILSTVTFQWFLERGFAEVVVSELPLSRQNRYDTRRKSKIYHKVLEGSRAFDEAEVLKHL